MGRRNKRDTEPTNSREQETGEGLTFLEKLVLRVLPNRAVPKESGVSFSVNTKAKEAGLCLIFKVDDARAPVVAEGPRPDYLVVFVSASCCIFTIVEMKGTEQHAVEHGVDQIRAMYKLLRQAMSECLPASWKRAVIQGVLLMPHNAQINRRKIEEAKKEGVEILPLEYHHQAELYPYISSKVSRTMRYNHQRLPHEKPELNDVEQLIVDGKRTQRKRDTFFQHRAGAAPDTFFLTFQSPKDRADCYVSLSTNQKDAVIGYSRGAEQRAKVVERHLKDRGINCSTLRFQMIDP
ncbi:MAG: hypothetical protein IPK82_35355 [Polyangiaceae bacterium]|nr:hypothetical protein [Polyangiaceae bacterium]